MSQKAVYTPIMGVSIVKAHGGAMKKQILIALNKPYGVLSQFTDAQQRPTLGDYVSVPDVYAAGRLDKDSEGLMLLTNDGRLQERITHPRFGLVKTYWTQVEGTPKREQLGRLQRGVQLRDGWAAAASVRCIDAPVLWDRHPPIRYRAHIPTHWLEVRISEGRNRQVRRMTAAVGLPTLRLVRVQIGPWRLDELLPGHWRYANAGAIKQKMKGRSY